MKTQDLSGAALDWAVATCEGYTALHMDEGYLGQEPQLVMFPPRREYGVMELVELRFSSGWDFGGFLIESERISITWECEKGWYAYIGDTYSYGETPLIAAMRCYVASKLGAEIELPKELK